MLTDTINFQARNAARALYYAGEYTTRVAEMRDQGARRNLFVAIVNTKSATAPPCSFRVASESARSWFWAVVQGAHFICSMSRSSICRIRLAR